MASLKSVFKNQYLNDEIHDLNYLKLNAVNIYLMPTVQKSQSWEYLKRCETCRPKMQGGRRQCR